MRGPFFGTPTQRGALDAIKKRRKGGEGDFLAAFFCSSRFPICPEGPLGLKEEEDTKRAGEKKCWEISKFSKLDFFRKLKQRTNKKYIFLYFFDRLPGQFAVS